MAGSTKQQTELAMIPWLQSNTAFVSMLTGIVTALIWLIYLQLLVLSQRRQRRAILSIDRGAGRGMDGRILVTNLGFEPVYVTDFIAVLHRKDEQFSANITERKEVARSELDTPLAATLQGPLETGQFRDLGSIQSIFDRIRHQQDMSDMSDLDEFELFVLARRERSTGARRSYRVVYQDGEPYLDADMMDTQRLSARKVKRLRRDLGYDVPRANNGRNVVSPT